MKSCLIFNPSARGEKAQRLHARLGVLPVHYTLKPTKAPGDARMLAAQAVREGFETIIAAGGDGTANEVVNGIGDVPDGFAQVRLGILPMGTVNVFARELGLPLDIPRAWAILQQGRELKVDLGQAEFLVSGQCQRRYFLQLAGAGLDSRAVELVDWELKKKYGPWAYVLAGWKALDEIHPLITVNGDAKTAGEQIFIGNGKRYGGSFVFFPDSNLQNGLLEICVFPKVNLWRALQALAGLVTGRLHQIGAALQLQSPAVTLASAGRVLLELDGENVGELPAKLSILPGRLRVIAP